MSLQSQEYTLLALSLALVACTPSETQTCDAMPCRPDLAGDQPLAYDLATFESSVVQNCWRTTRHVHFFRNGTLGELHAQVFAMAIVLDETSWDLLDTQQTFCGIGGVAFDCPLSYPPPGPTLLASYHNAEQPILNAEVYLERASWLTDEPWAFVWRFGGDYPGLCDSTIVVEPWDSMGVEVYLTPLAFGLPPDAEIRSRGWALVRWIDAAHEGCFEPTYPSPDVVGGLNPLSLDPDGDRVFWVGPTDEVISPVHCE